MHYNNGLKFSFSLLAQTPSSSHATPKFPSIEIEKEMKPKHKQNPSTRKEQGIQRSRSSSPNYKKHITRPNSKGKRMLEKYAHLTLLGDNDKKDKDCKSLRSIQSSNSHKYYRSKTETTSSLTKSTTKHRQSVITATHLQTHIQTESHKNKSKNGSKSSSKADLHAQYIRKRLFDDRSAERMENGYARPINVVLFKERRPKFRDIQAKKLQEIPDKGKSFKSILCKARPVLRIGSRILNNTRLEQMSKPLQIQDYN